MFHRHDETVFVFILSDMLTIEGQTTVFHNKSPPGGHIKTGCPALGVGGYWA